MSTKPPAPPGSLSARHVWNVPDFPSLPSAVGTNCRSKAFRLCGERWELHLYPGGINDQVAGFVSLYLRFVGSGAVLVDYHMAVKNSEPAESLVLSSTRAIELAAEDTGAAPEMQFTGFSMLIPREALLGPAGGFANADTGAVSIELLLSVYPRGGGEQQPPAAQAAWGAPAPPPVGPAQMDAVADREEQEQLEAALEDSQMRLAESEGRCAKLASAAARDAGGGGGAEVARLRAALDGYGGMSAQQVTELTNTLHRKLTEAEAKLASAAVASSRDGAKDERRVRKEKKARAQSIGAAQAAVGQLQREHRQLAEHAAAQRRGVASELAQLEAALLAGVAAAAAAADARLAEALLDRRRLLNTVLDLRGNIRVFCRCRPVQRHEGAEGNLVRVLSSAGKDEVVVADDRRKKHVRHEFDAAFGDATTQQQVFGQATTSASWRTARPAPARPTRWWARRPSRGSPAGRWSCFSSCRPAGYLSMAYSCTTVAFCV